VIDSWIEQLGSKNPTERITAENALINSGTAAEAPLIAILSIDDDESRWRAATVLGDIKAIHAIDPLYSLLKHAVYDTRAAATYALGMIGEMHAFDTLAEVAFGDEPDEQLPYVAALGLLRLNRDRALNLLNHALRHPLEPVRRMAMTALATDRYAV
jgi:HEAT repeat protein